MFKIISKNELLYLSAVVFCRVLVNYSAIFKFWNFN